jgi:hypothetical protein
MPNVTLPADEPNCTVPAVAVFVPAAKATPAAARNDAVIIPAVLVPKLTELALEKPPIISCPVGASVTAWALFQSDGRISDVSASSAIRLVFRCWMVAGMEDYSFFKLV